MTRPSWDEYFLTLAAAVSTRATCSRKRVGCVLVKDRRILATGFNGALAGHPHCTEVGCLMVDGHCARTVHSEVNAIAQAARAGVATEGAVVYVTAKPCWPCLKTLIGAGIKAVWYEEDYGAEYPITPPIPVLRA